MSPRSQTIALFASAALNLFLIGAVIGGLVIARQTPSALAAQSANARPLWIAADRLPPAEREAYRAVLRAQAPSVAGQVRQARLIRRQAWETLSREPVDTAQVGRELASARALEMAARGGVEDKIIAFAATLSPAERAELADGLARSAPNPRLGMRRLRGAP